MEKKASEDIPYSRDSVVIPLYGTKEITYMMGNKRDKHASKGGTADKNGDNNAYPILSNDSSTSILHEELSKYIWPEENPDRSCMTRFFDGLFYTYMNRIFRKGAALHKSRQERNDVSKLDSVSFSSELSSSDELQIHDLYGLASFMKADVLHEKFQSLNNLTKEKLISNPKSHQSTPTSTDKQNQKRILYLALKLVYPIYFRAGIWQLFATTCHLGIPLCVFKILQLLEDNPRQKIIEEGMMYAILIFLLNVMEGISQERHKFLAFQSGILLRSSVINAIYNHVLTLTPSGKLGLSTGEVTNLVAVDAQKLYEVLEEGHLVWSCPLSMIVVTILLLVTMGPSTIVGMLYMFLQVPIVHRVVMMMMKFRKQRVHLADQRVQITTCMLQGIKFTKLNNYESKFLERISEIRNKESKYIRKELVMISITMVLTVLTPVIACGLAFTTYALMDDGNILTSSKVFTTLFLYSALRFPINYFGKLMGKAAQGLQACTRLGIFFARETLPPNKSSLFHTLCSDENDDLLLNINNGSFTISNSAPVTFESGDARESRQGLGNISFNVSNINLKLKRSQILAVVGPVGSGKSTLIKGLIGEIEKENGSIVELYGKVAYASQIPFILNGTIRENILFGEKYDEHRYEQTLQICNLNSDLDQIGPSRDLTEIGERGVTLSGGQKSRVSLARCIYSNPNVCILDDPLSALDAVTGKRVFENIMKSLEDGFLDNCTVVLVTHTPHFLHRIDKILLLVGGKSSFLGSWNEIKTYHPSDPISLEAINHIRSAIQEGKPSDDFDIDKSVIIESEIKESRISSERGTLITREDRQFGISKLKTWIIWFQNAGGIFFFLGSVGALALDRLTYILTELWLAAWIEGATKPVSRLGHTFAPQSDGRSSQVEYLKVYAFLLCLSFLLCLVRSLWIVQGGGRCSVKLFKAMIARVVLAPMSYFESTPSGRILNRVSYDVETMDVTLSQAMSILLVCCGWFFAGVTIMTTILPWIMLLIIPICALYWALTLMYRKSAVDLQRLDAVSRSPLQSLICEGLDGSTTIRTLGKSEHYRLRFQRCVNENSLAMMNFMASQRWLAVRIHILGSLAVLFATVSIVSNNDVMRLDAGIAGILIVWSSSFTVTLGFFVQSISDTEAYITSIERVHDMTKIPQEKDKKNENSVNLSPSWPKIGSIQFDKVALRYREGLPLALDGLSFHIKSGQRCGVVGRTGAGKSTLTTALFRLVEIERGRILLDGVDLATIGLTDVRGRTHGMSIIPQDPVLFPGTLRECVDPFGSSTDDEIIDALTAVRVANVETRGRSALDDLIEESGSNFSVGERQLLCLARAIISRPKVLVLDEATASVDAETDAFIQRMLRSRFEDTTLLTIAHRLNTIMDYDVILVMDNGKAKEFGSPRDLLNLENGLFTELVDSTGKDSSQVLRSLVKDT